MRHYKCQLITLEACFGTFWFLSKNNCQFFANKITLNTLDVRPNAGWTVHETKRDRKWRNQKTFHYQNVNIIVTRYTNNVLFGCNYYENCSRRGVGVERARAHTYLPKSFGQSLHYTLCRCVYSHVFLGKVMHHSFSLSLSTIHMHSHSFSLSFSQVNVHSRVRRERD